MRLELEYKSPARVSITQNRWDIRITVEMADGQIRQFVASADHGATFGDGIFFGTPEEYRETIGL